MNIGPTSIKMRIEPLKFHSSCDDIEAFTTLRGDVATGNTYSEINLCDYTGDIPQHVMDCRQALCEHLGIGLGSLIMPRQTHTANIAVVDDDFMALDAPLRQVRLNAVDGLVTRLQRVAIGVNTADCVPIALRERKSEIIAIVHAGWRGTVARIAANAVTTMALMGADISEIEAAIGASICQKCFEVGDEVVEQFSSAGFNISQLMQRDALTGKAHINLQAANVAVLNEAGIKIENIKISGNCTRCNPHKYFSARRLGINSGRTFTFIIRH
jgi:polyphenol oxidase